MKFKEITLDGVSEICERFPVKLARTQYGLLLEATNEGGYNGIAIDFNELMAWVKANDVKIKALEDGDGC